MKQMIAGVMMCGISILGFANEITIGNCSIEISKNDFDKRDDGSYYEKVDYSKFEYSKKEIDKVDLKKDGDFLLSEDTEVFKSNDLYMFAYILSFPDVDVQLNTVVAIDHDQAYSFFGFSIEDFKDFSKNCGFVFFESSIEEYNQWVKEK